MELRPYQSKIIVDLRDGYVAGHERQLLVLATGGGKTVIFSYITKSSSSRGKRTIIMAHRSEILDQISATLTQVGVDHGMITAKSRPNRDKLVQVASIQTLVRRFDAIQPPDLLIFDESHHMAASQWSKVLAQYPKAKVLGVTATPERLDGRGLGEFFQKLVRGPEVQWLIDNGFLSKPVYYAPASPIDFSQVRLIAGEYAKDEAEAVMDKPSITGDIVSHYKKLCAGKRAIAFCISIKHAEHISAQFAAAGIPSATIDGKLTPEVRKQRVEDLRAGRIMVMTSCEIVNEGFDLPAVDVGILCRPTKSLALHLQQCLDSKTQILTDRGWVGHEDINRSDNVASFGLETGRVEWGAAKQIIKRQLADGEKMYGICSPHLDIRVTSQHEMVVKSKSGTCINWQKGMAEQVATRRSHFQIPVSAGCALIAEANLSDFELRFVGWFLTDGTMNVRSGQVSIAQSARKTTHCSAIREAIIGCGMKFGECLIKRTGEFEKHADSLIFYISKGKPRGSGKHLKGWGYLEKWLDKNIGSIFDTLSRRQFCVMLEAMDLGDGNNCDSCRSWIRRTITLACGTNERFADRIQAMCAVRGIRCNKARQHYEGRGVWFALHIKDVNTSSIAGTHIPNGTIEGKNYHRSRFSEVPSQPAELVWCVETNAGTLITRRNGKVSIMGNCGRTLRTRPGKTESIILDHVGNCIIHGLAEERREWSLDGKSKNKRPKEAVLETRQCKECFAIYLGTVCPQCGSERESKVRELEIKEGELKRLESEELLAKRKEKNELRNCKTYEDIQRYGREKGYKPGWAYHRWKTIQHFKAARTNRSTVSDT